MSLSGSALAHLIHRGASGEALDDEGRERASRPKVLALGARGGQIGAGQIGAGQIDAGQIDAGELDAALPDGGVPRGAVVELASTFGLARSTSMALAACAAAQRQSLSWAPRAAWCAWLDPWATLHAPGVRAAGIALERLLVVRPAPDGLARCAVRIASSRAFAVVVVDTVCPLDGEDEVRLDRWATVTRRLALAVEGTETILILLTDLTARRALPLPVAMRIELERGFGADGSARSSLRVAKERHGRIGGPVPILDDGLRPPLRSATPRG